MEPVNLDEFRAGAGGAITPGKPERAPRHKAGEWFIKGPLPGPWIGRAAGLPGRALHVALALWHLAGLANGRRVKPTWRIWDRFGVSPDTGRRGLLALERAGLVEVKRGSGRCPDVRILDAN